MEPEGILKAWTTKTRIANASNIAMMMASAYSRRIDLWVGWSATARRGSLVVGSVGAGVVGPFVAGTSSGRALGSTLIPRLP